MPGLSAGKEEVVLACLLVLSDSGATEREEVSDDGQTILPH